MGYRDYWERYYEPSRPRPVKDGIKAKSTRGKIGETWWSGRWIAVLESLNLGARLVRGRAYARKGQVMNLDIQTGVVRARVQGSRPNPYQVTIKLAPLSGGDWDKVIQAMAAQAIFAAKLLAGEMPQNIEEAFQEAHVSLFPSRGRDLETDCSCPDWSNPCKHIAAVYYLLAEEFDRDPFLIFRLRGKEQDQLIAALRELRASGEVASSASEATPSDSASGIEPPPPLEDCLERFWIAGEGLASFHPDMAPPEVPEAVLRRLGPPPLGKNAEGALEALIQAYQTVRIEALKLAYSQEEAVDAPA